MVQPDPMPVNSKASPVISMGLTLKLIIGLHSLQTQVAESEEGDVCTGKCQWMRWVLLNIPCTYRTFAKIPFIHVFPQILVQVMMASVPSLKDFPSISISLY